MMVNILMYISSGLVLSGFIGYILLVLINDRKSIDVDGFNITKDILNKYDSINIIENNGYFTFYNIKRKVIKIASKFYYGNSVSSVAVPLIEAGISVVDNNKNKFIMFMKKVIPNLKCLYVLPIIAVVFNNISSGITDAKVGVLLLSFMVVIMYMVIDVKSEALLWIDSRLKNNNDITQKQFLNIVNFLKNVILFDKLIFIGELVMIIQFVAIIMNFSL